MVLDLVKYIKNIEIVTKTWEMEQGGSAPPHPPVVPGPRLRRRIWTRTRRTSYHSTEVRPFQIGGTVRTPGLKGTGGAAGVWDMIRDRKSGISYKLPHNARRGMAWRSATSNF